MSSQYAKTYFPYIVLAPLHLCAELNAKVIVWADLHWVRNMNGAAPEPDLSAISFTCECATRSVYSLKNFDFEFPAMYNYVLPREMSSGAGNRNR